MADTQLIAYIRDCLSKNIPVEQIKRDLLEKGWQEWQINEAINLITSTESQQPSQPTQSSQMPQTQAVSSEKSSPKLLWVFLGIFVFALIAILIFFLIRSSNTISGNKLTQGASVDLAEKGEVKFKINGEEHKVIIDSIQEDSVDITIQSDPISATLNIGETEKFDLDSDDTYDLLIKLKNITNQKADLYIKKISEAICTEDWQCEDWSDCVNETQTRVCEDLNDCGTEEEKSDESQECEITLLNCSTQGGFLCGETEVCNGTITNASEGECCLGNCTLQEIELVDCGTDIDCLINASETCSLANVTYDFTSGNTTWTQSNSHYYKIRGFEDEKCKLYQEILDASGNFTNSQWTTLLIVNTIDEINQMIQQINTGLGVGNTGICRFSTYALEDYLTEVKAGNYELSTEEQSTYECSGSLYGA